MAEETFNQLYERYNTDDVFNRVVIIGLLDLLNHKLKYNQIWDDNVVEEVVVPFMYDFGSSDERFAQDNYAFFGTTFVTNDDNQPIALLSWFYTFCVYSPCTETILDDSCLAFTMRQRLTFYSIPYLSHVGTLHKFRQRGKLPVHLLQLGSYGKDQLDSLPLRHLLVYANLANGIHDTKALVDDTHIDVVSLVMKPHGYGIDRRITYLGCQFSHVLT